MTNLLNERDVRILWRLLGFPAGSFADLRCINVNQGGVVNRAIIQANEEEFVKWARTFNGQGNCFVGRNPRTKDGNVSAVQCFTIDIDPERPKGTASSDEGHNQSLLLAQRLLAKYPGGSVASSGNGALVMWRIKPLTDVEGATAGVKGLEERIRAAFQTPALKIDQTGDAARLIKLIGTVSTKGPKETWRMSRWVAAPNNCHASVIANAIEAVGGSAKSPAVLPDYDHARYPQRANAEFALAARCKLAGMSPEQTYQTLEQYGFMPGRHDDHRRVIEKVFGRDVPSTGNAGVSNGGAVLRAEAESAVNDFDNWLGELDERSKLSGPELPTGFDALDKILWGHKPGELFTVGARTGHGKTSWAVTVAESLRQRGRRVLFFSTELDKRRILEKFVQVAKGVTEFEFTSGHLSATSKRLVAEYKEELKRNPYIVCDEGKPSVSRVRQEIERHKPDLVVFDYIGRIGEDPNTVAAYVRDLKDVVKQQRVAALVMAMLNEPERDPKTGKEFDSKRGDIRMSKEIINEAAVFLHIAKGPMTGGQYQPVFVHIDKARYGGTDQIIELRFNRLVSRFEEPLNAANLSPV